MIYRRARLVCVLYGQPTGLTPLITLSCPREIISPFFRVYTRHYNISTYYHFNNSSRTCASCTRHIIILLCTYDVV